jgi:Pyruvate/2-oxoacid:ferredoxin oxidoreductase delta subunit
MANAPKLTVVISQGQSKRPAHQEMEENIAAALLMEPGVELSVVPHLYDLHEGHTGLMFLRSVRSNLVVLSWLFPRAAHWTLDRFGVKGALGEVQLVKPKTDEDEDEGDEEAAAKRPPIGAAALPDRSVYCLDLRDFDDPDLYVREIRRIAEASKPKGPAKMLVDLSGWLRGAPTPTAPEPKPDHEPVQLVKANELLATPDRRWYPVIDYGRCTNCMECIDFCLFGVYGVDALGRINVDNQDNCRKGCPACSRVCPEHAIIFPQHKSSAIAGDNVAGPGALKIDLSRLFGGPSAVEVAARERDEQLVAVGRDAVGMAVGIPKRRTGKDAGPKDDMDKLADALDSLDL